MILFFKEKNKRECELLNTLFSVRKDAWTCWFLCFSLFWIKDLNSGVLLHYLFMKVRKRKSEGCVYNTDVNVGKRSLQMNTGVIFSCIWHNYLPRLQVSFQVGRNTEDPLPSSRLVIFAVRNVWEADGRGFFWLPRGEAKKLKSWDG